jgi:hypothetical protein
MAGIDHWNYPAFHDAAKVLRNRGHEVYNPSEISADTSLPSNYYMRHCIGALLRAEIVVVLPGWQESWNAETEVRIAQALGLPVITLERALSEEPHDPFYDFAMEHDGADD